MKQRQEFDRHKQTRTISDPNVIIEELRDALCNPKREQETLDSVLKEVQAITAKQSRTMQMIRTRRKVTESWACNMIRERNRDKILLVQKVLNDYVLCIAIRARRVQQSSGQTKTRREDWWFCPVVSPAGGGV